MYFKKQKACCDSTGNDLSKEVNSCCTDQVEEKQNRPKSQKVQKIFLWMGTVVVAATLVGGSNMDNSTVEVIPKDECCSDVQATEMGEGTSCCSDSTTNKEISKEASACCPE